MNPWVDLVFDFEPSEQDALLLSMALQVVGHPCTVTVPEAHTLRLSHPSGEVVVAAAEWFNVRMGRRGVVDPT